MGVFRTVMLVSHILRREIISPPSLGASQTETSAADKTGMFENHRIAYFSSCGRIFSDVVRLVLWRSADFTITLEMDFTLEPSRSECFE